MLVWFVWGSATAFAAPPAATVEPLVRVVDLARRVAGSHALRRQQATVKLLGGDETTDPVRDAIRQAVVEVEVNGVRAELTSANYELPKTVGGVADRLPDHRRLPAPTPIETPGAWRRTRGCGSGRRARRWVRPGTFAYPLGQRWFATRHPDGQRAVLRQRLRKAQRPQDLLPLRPGLRRREGHGRGGRGDRRAGRLGRQRAAARLRGHARQARATT